jgi:iron complex outermembrane receptor protein
MTDIARLRASASAFALFAAFAPLAATADDTPSPAQDILVVAQKQTQSIENVPTSRATITADLIADTVNAVSVEDTLKYLPSLIVRKRNIGDTQAPLATRTSGLGASARSLIYADGALLSSLIGNNNTSASPRWGLVSAEEIARIDVLYGPFSAGYAGNSIGAVVNITTRLPDKLEGTLSAATSVQPYDQYGTHRTLPAYQLGATLGDRFGALYLFGSVTHTISNSQPIGYVTGTRSAVAARSDVPTIGGYDDVNRTSQAIRVLGATALQHQIQDNIKFKAALDLSSSLRLTYVGGLFLNNSAATVETYLTNAATGLPTYVSPASPAAKLNVAGYGYTVAASAFDGGLYRFDERHWSHALSATGHGGRFDWQVIGTIYTFARDTQRTAGDPLPAAFTGGAGTITRLDGTGWKTFDAKGAFHPGDANTISAGVHWDRYVVNSNRYATTDWIGGGEGALNQASRGKTQTAALWAQDEIRIAMPLTLTLGGRFEWWRAFDGFNYSLAPALSVDQPRLSAQGFSPKASLGWTPAPGWTARLSFGKAYRFATVGELYQAITTGTVLSVPNPDLRPERALSEELAIEHHDAHGNVRLSLFNESIEDALISQSGPLNGTATIATFVQNVDRTRARGVELALLCINVASAPIDVSGSVTYTDATTRKDTAFPAAVGKLLPSVPHWKATAIVTWRPTGAIALTTAARYAGRNYGSLDNSDAVGNTYQGFYKYFVVDLRAAFRITDHYRFAIGVDNVNNDKYFLFHPFPQRSFHADLTVKL